MYRGFVLLSIFGLNSGHSPAELNGTGDPGGTPAPAKLALTVDATSVILSDLLYLLKQEHHSDLKSLLPVWQYCQ
jgi:hypothetical protein